jgi:predicted metalloprotease
MSSGVRAVTAALIATVATMLAAGCGSAGGSTSAPESASASPSASATSTPSVSDAGASALPSFPAATASPSLPAPSTATAEQRFIAAVFNDAQDEWQSIFAKAGKQYHPARLVLFSSAVRTGCGDETAEVGPFYCPADQTVYLDVTFFKEMEAKYGVKGDFSQAYVVAHELGHHIQNILGVSTQVAQLSQQYPAQANALSIRTELQADCYG